MFAHSKECDARELSITTEWDGHAILVKICKNASPRNSHTVHILFIYIILHHLITLCLSTHSHALSLPAIFMQKREILERHDFSQEKVLNRTLTLLNQISRTKTKIRRSIFGNVQSIATTFLLSSRRIIEKEAEENYYKLFFHLLVRCERKILIFILL